VILGYCVASGGGPAARAPERLGDDPSADATSQAAATNRVSIQPTSVRLDWARGEMVIDASVTDRDRTRPTQLWVWAFFINPGEDNGQGSRSDQPIEVTPTWNEDGTAQIQARGPFHWHNTSGVPRRGYLARVYVSTQSAAAVQIRASERNKSPAGMVEVQ